MVLTIMEIPLEPFLPMEVSKNLCSSVAARIACVLLLADFRNLQALYSAVKLSQSVDLSSSGGTLELPQLVEVAKNILSSGTAGMACILLPGDQLPDGFRRDDQLPDGFRSSAASSSSCWCCFGVSA